MSSGMLETRAPPSCSISPMLRSRRTSRRRRDPTASRQPGRPGASREPADRHARPMSLRPLRKAAEGIAARLALWNAVQNVWYGMSPRLRPAARRHRPRHHLRHDGRHQHGPWRDGDDRRLHDLRGAGGHPHPCAGPVRRLAVHRAAARLPGRRRRSASPSSAAVIRFLYGRPLETLLATWGLSLILQQARAHDLRPDQPRGRNAGLDERRVGARRA